MERIYRTTIRMEVILLISRNLLKWLGSSVHTEPPEPKSKTKYTPSLLNLRCIMFLVSCRIILLIYH